MFKYFLKFIFIALLSAQPFLFAPLSEAKDTSVDQRDMNKWFAAAQKNDTVLLRQLISQEKTNLKTLLERRDNKGRTALLIATHNNAIEAAKMLIKLGADVNAKDHKLRQSLFICWGRRKIRDIKTYGRIRC